MDVFRPAIQEGSPSKHAFLRAHSKNRHLKKSSTKKQQFLTTNTTPMDRSLAQYDINV